MGIYIHISLFVNT